MSQPPRRKHRKKPLSEIIRKILKYGQEAYDWTSSTPMAEWLQDTKSIRATAMNLQIVGEEVNTLLIIWESLLEGSNFCVLVPMERWRALQYLRHGISHDYDNIDEINFYFGAKNILNILIWAEVIEKNLAIIEVEEKLKDNPRLVFSPYAEN